MHTTTQVTCSSFWNWNHRSHCLPTFRKECYRPAKWLYYAFRLTHLLTGAAHFVSHTRLPVLSKVSHTHIVTPLLLEIHSATASHTLSSATLHCQFSITLTNVPMINGSISSKTTSAKISLAALRLPCCRLKILSDTLYLQKVSASSLPAPNHSVYFISILCYHCLPSFSALHYTFSISISSSFAV